MNNMDRITGPLHRAGWWLDVETRTSSTWHTVWYRRDDLDVLVVMAWPGGGAVIWEVEGVDGHGQWEGDEAACLALLRDCKLAGEVSK